MEKALEGVRIVDFSWVLAGPYATRILADFGAEVIKVQSKVTMEGDINATGYFNTWNRNKLGITLNLNKPKGVEIAKRLIGISDVVVENFSPRVMANWGLDYEVLKEIKPDLIMVSLSGIGQTGPWRNYVAFGATIQALSGLTYLTTLPNYPPIGLGYSYADHVAGLIATVAILEALEYRQESGEGQYIDLSELEAMLTLLGPAILNYTANGQVAIPVGNRPTYFSTAPYGVYRCKGEDRWCAISVSTQEEWEAFSKALGSPEWTKEERFATLQARLKNVDELDRLIEEWTSKYSAEEVMSLLQASGVACGVIQDAHDLSQDPQLKARGFFVEAEHPLLGKVVFDASPIKLSQTPAQFERPAPLLGQDNDYVYRQLLGIGEQEMERYWKEGVFI